jgi:hypothetical protein
VSSVDEEDFNQTWMQLNVIEASKPWEVRVAAKPLEFKFPVKGKDKLDIF